MRVVLSLLLVSFFALCSSAFGAPVLRVEMPNFDFGEVLQGDKVPHVFKFTNEGDEILQIDRVRSSCGCTAVLVAEKTIPPGGVGEIKANFDSSRFRGDVSKTIYVYSNDPVDPTKQLHLKGKVLEKITVEPSQINFGTVAPKQTVTSQVVIRNQVEKPMVVGKPKSTAEELTVKMTEATLTRGEEVTIELELTPKPGQTRFSGYVLVPVDGVPRNELRIPVYATIKQ